MQNHATSTKQSIIKRTINTIKSWFRPAPPPKIPDAIEELQRILTRKLYEGEG
jgi:hypothetical protein